MQCALAEPWQAWTRTIGIHRGTEALRHLHRRRDDARSIICTMPLRLVHFIVISLREESARVILSDLHDEPADSGNDP